MGESHDDNSHDGHGRRKGEEDAAATRIQATFRGHRVRREMGAVGVLHKEATVMEAGAPTDEASLNSISASDGHTPQPAHSVEKEPTPTTSLDTDGSREDAAATRIQASFRGHRTRKQVQLLRGAVDADGHSAVVDEYHTSSHNDSREEEGDDATDEHHDGSLDGVEDDVALDGDESNHHDVNPHTNSDGHDRDEDEQHDVRNEDDRRHVAVTAANDHTSAARHAFPHAVTTHGHASHVSTEIAEQEAIDAALFAKLMATGGLDAPSVSPQTSASHTRVGGLGDHNEDEGDHNHAHGSASGYHENAAATRIQAGYRGHRARQQMRELRAEEEDSRRRAAEEQERWLMEAVIAGEHTVFKIGPWHCVFQYVGGHASQRSPHLTIVNRFRTELQRRAI